MLDRFKALCENNYYKFLQFIYYKSDRYVSLHAEKKHIENIKFYKKSA